MPILIFNALLRDVPLPILNVTVIANVTSVTLTKHGILQPHAVHPACGSVIEQDKA